MSEKKESLDDLIQNIKPKRRNLIHEHFLKDKSEEEIKEWRAQAAKKRSEAWAIKRKAKEEMVEKAKELAPHMLAYDMLSEEVKKDNWIPSQDLIDKVKYLLKADMPLETLRAKYFTQISDKTWHHLMKFVFKSQVSASEDLGAEIMRVKQRTCERIKKQIREYKKQIKVYCEEKKTKIIPAYLLNLKRDAESELMRTEREVAETLFKVGAVGEKSKAPSFIVNMKMDRPKEKEVIVVDGN
jgi:hypothetical protein